MSFIPEDEIFEYSNGEFNFLSTNEPKLDEFFETGINIQEESHQDFKETSHSQYSHKSDKRKDQNYNRSLTRKLLDALESAHLIQPKSIERKPKNIGDLRLILVIIRQIPEK